VAMQHKACHDACRCRLKCNVNTEKATIVDNSLVNIGKAALGQNCVNNGKDPLCRNFNVTVTLTLRGTW
jgi:hypothetical protein